VITLRGADGTCRPHRACPSTTGENYQALDTKALALCGLALIAHADQLAAARAAFQAARAKTRERGIVGRVLRMFDTLAAADQDGVLSPIRSAAAGEA
jgi:hypothetical protein